MKYKKLGKTNIEVSVVGLDIWFELLTDQRKQLITRMEEMQKSLEGLGINHVDQAVPNLTGFVG